MEGALRPLVDVVLDTTRIEEWSKLVLGAAQDDANGWQKLTASPVRLKGGLGVKIVETRGRRERTRTIPLEDWPGRAADLLEQPLAQAHLLTRSRDWHARRTKKGRWLVSSGKPSSPETRIAGHDRERSYPLPPEHPQVRRLLVATGIFSPQGNLRSGFADKYRQVQHYVELLRPLPVWEAARREGRPLRIVDAGCGKAYMSLALYVYGELVGVEVELVGLDRDPELIEKVRGIAQELGYERARFEATTIEEASRAHAGERVDLLVSLHACDTATDEALAAGVRLDADAIVLAPCCHHELASQLHDGDLWGAVTSQGLLRGRLAELITDALRTSALEQLGYRAEAIEFVAAEHTAKNLMIRAARRRPGPFTERARVEARERYRALAAAWQVKPALEAMLGDRWPARAE